jgi:hypothetical protein
MILAPTRTHPSSSSVTAPAPVIPLSPSNHVPENQRKRRSNSESISSPSKRTSLSDQRKRKDSPNKDSTSTNNRRSLRNAL